MYELNAFMSINMTELNWWLKLYSGIATFELACVASKNGHLHCAECWSACSNNRKRQIIDDTHISHGDQSCWGHSHQQLVKRARWIGLGCLQRAHKQRCGWFAYVCVRPSSDHAERDVVMHQWHSFAPVETRVHDEGSSAANCTAGIFLWHTIHTV